MKKRTIYDILHNAERSVKSEGLMDQSYLTQIQIFPVSQIIREMEKFHTGKAFNVNVTKFSVNIYNPLDIRISNELESDRVYLHDVYSNLNHVFRSLTSDGSGGGAIQGILKRARELKMTLDADINIAAASQIRGAQLQRVIRLGKDYLKILDLFYNLNALSMAGSSDSELVKILSLIFPTYKDNEKVLRSKMAALVACSHLIEDSTISESVIIYNMLSGTVMVSGDLNDDIVHYANAVQLINAEYTLIKD